MVPFLNSVWRFFSTVLFVLSPSTLRNLNGGAVFAQECSFSGWMLKRSSQRFSTSGGFVTWWWRGLKLRPGNTPTCNWSSRSTLLRLSLCFNVEKWTSLLVVLKTLISVFKDDKYWRITSFTCEETVSVFLTLSRTIIQILLWGTWCQVTEIRAEGTYYQC